MKKKRFISLLLALCLAFALLPAAALADPGAAPTAADPSVLAATPNVLSIKITMTTPEVGKPLPTTAKTSSNANYEVTKVEWSGATDSNGNMAYDTVYTAVFTVEIKKGKDTKFSTAAAKEFVKNASLNGEYKGFTSAEKVSNTMVKLTYELPAVKKPSTTISKLDNIHLIVRRYYYSCNRCAKCEYNPNHTWVGMDLGNDRLSEHQYTVKTVSDEHFLGTNAQGDRVYLTCCETCGKDHKQVALATTYDYYKNVMGMDGDYSYYQLYMEKEKKAWSKGGTAYEMRMKATPGKDYLDGYVVTADHFVTAKTSGWATQDVQVAANDGLVDKALLGNNYTQGITRLQFCSIAVKMTEKMLGKSITPAPATTFTDTNNEYALKAYTAGITTGVGGNRFSPSGALTRQEMATFLYRALQYVKANSDTEYTVYTSKLGSYTDAGKVASWAKDAMAFMNGLGLINGTSNTTLSPGDPCTIEQALIVADRSLDAGGIGWYQYVSDGIGSYNAPGFGYFTYGERIWCTSSKGDCVDPRGVACTIPITHFYPIKDR